MRAAPLDGLSPKPSFQGVLFDLDGVIRHWGDAHLRAAAARYDVPRDLILRATFGCPAFREALVGKLPAEAWHASARETLCEMVGRDVGGAVDEFIAYPGRIDGEMLALVDRLRQLLRVGLLSNGTTTLELHIQVHDLERHFDVIVNTARIGVAKPDEEAFRIAALRLGVPPQRCIFVDDTKANVEGARAAGFTGVHYKGLQDLVEDLKRLDPKLAAVAAAT